MLPNLHEALRGAWRVMWVNRVRTALTLLGIVIGVASVIVMLAIGEGARQKVMAEMGALGATLLYVGGDIPPDGGPEGQIDEGDLAAIGELPQVRRVIAAIGDPIVVRYGNRAATLYAQGITAELPQIQRWPVAKGRFFTERESREVVPVAVIGQKVLKRFFPDGENPIGKQLLLANSVFEIVGVMTEKGSSGGEFYDPDERILLPYRSALVRVYQRQYPDYVMVDAMDSQAVGQAEMAINELLMERHRRKDFSVDNAGARLNAEMETRRSLSMMLGLIAVVSLVVGGIGVMNVMLMTVKERTREIGIRMATGARQRDILRQFLFEAVMVSLVGGVAGVAAGLAIGGGLLLWGVPMGFSIVAVLGAFGCAVAAGLVFGIAPARAAARLDPVQALAGE